MTGGHIQSPFVQHSGLTLQEYLIEILKPYPDVLDGIKKITNMQTEEYRVFHTKALNEHVGTLEIRQRGITYQVNRKSNIRNTPAYERYIYAISDDNLLWKDDVNVACRYFKAHWNPWFTIRLK